jgi:hypothetical protein
MKPAVRRSWVVLALSLLLTACPADRPPEMPQAEEAAERYGPGIVADVRGNLLEVQVPMTADHLRGGAIWARSGPYFYLFSPATRDLFAEYRDLAAIRMITRTPEGEEIARAELHRDALTEVRWREALYRSAVAQRDGTERPSTLEALTFFGEDITEFQYNPEFAGR